MNVNTEVYNKVQTAGNTQEQEGHIRNKSLPSSECLSLFADETKIKRKVWRS